MEELEALGSAGAVAVACLIAASVGAFTTRASVRGQAAEVTR